MLTCLRFYQRDLSCGDGDHISELEGLLEGMHDATGKLTQALQDRAAEVKSARLVEIYLLYIVGMYVLIL